MCKALTTSASSSGAKQVIILKSKLILGINVHDSVIHFPKEDTVFRNRTRPFLKYFGSVLEKFHVDVTLFTLVPQAQKDAVFHRFFREFPVSKPNFYFNNSGNRAEDDVYQDILDQRARMLGSTQKRILFIDAATRHHVTPKQTIILEKFEPKTRRIRASERAKRLATPEQGQIAMTHADYTLIALAEMIKEIAMSQEPVADYLKREPMIEKVKVPFFGEANLLPMENCDHIDQIDLEALDVREASHVLTEEEEAMGDGVHEVKETDAHKDLFK